MIIDKDASFKELELFFDALEKFGCEWWIINAQVRKKDGERGAPIGDKFGSKLAWHTSKAAVAANELESRVVKTGRARYGIDIVCTESPRADGARKSLFIDDLNSDRLSDFACVVGWVIHRTGDESRELSMLAYCCLVATPQRLELTRKIVIKFGGDSAAVSTGQLHRLPGSKNNKPACLASGGPFITKLSGINYGQAVTQKWEQEIPESKSALEYKSKMAETAAITGSSAEQLTKEAGYDNSALAFAWAIRELKNGTSEAEVLDGLTIKWLSHHSSRDWPIRTLHNALHAIGLKEIGTGQQVNVDFLYPPIDFRAI